MRFAWIVMLAGCATQQAQYQWMHDAGAGRNEFERDYGYCEAQALATHPALPVERGVGVFAGCMRSKGWRLVER